MADSPPSAWQLSGQKPVLCNGGTQQFQKLLEQGCHLCHAASAHLVIRTNVNGVKCVGLECDGCGRVETQGLRREYFQNWQDFPPYEGAAKLEAFHRNQWLEQQARLTQKFPPPDQLALARKAEYEAFLRTRRWYDLKAQIWERDQYVCQACGQTKKEYQLSVHHLSYALGLEPPNWLLVTVCKHCHARLHASKNGFSDEWDPTSLA